MSLSNKYFRTIQTTTIKEVTDKQYQYSVIKPLGNPMILFSKVDGSPLASLHLACPDTVKHGSLALITKRPTRSKFNCDFQGIINKDDQEFELIITNMSHDSCINFNVLKHDSSSNKTSYMSLNKVNSLRPMESYAIQADQETNKSLILSCIKRIVEGKDVKMTVKESEDSVKSVDDKPEGTYFYLSVTPQIDKPELVNKFKDTVWDCVDMFVMKKEVIIPNSIPKVNYFEGNHLMYSQPSTWQLFGDSMGIPRIGPSGDPGPRGPPGPSDPVSVRNRHLINITKPIGVRTIGSSWKNASHDLRSMPTDVTFDMQTNMPDPSDQSDRSYQETELNELMRGYKENLKKSKIIQERKGQKIDYKEDCGNECLFGGNNDSYDIDEIDSIDMDDYNDSNSNSFKDSKPKTVSQNLIDDSYASKIVAGRDVVINSTKCTIEFNYDVQSTPCIICLSVSDKLEFVEDDTDEEALKTTATSMIDEFVKNATKRLLDKIKTVYKEDNCVICMEGENEGRPTDTVFYQCGHQCCHYECGGKLKQCPLCRGQVAGVIKI